MGHSKTGVDWATRLMQTVVTKGIKRGLTTFRVGGNVHAYESGDELFERNRPKKESLLAKSPR